MFALLHFRTFLGLTAESMGGLLESYVQAVDSCLAEYNLPLYYKVCKCLDVIYTMCVCFITCTMCHQLIVHP